MPSKATVHEHIFRHLHSFARLFDSLTPTKDSDFARIQDSAGIWPLTLVAGGQEYFPRDAMIDVKPEVGFCFFHHLDKSAQVIERTGSIKEPSKATNCPSSGNL